MSTKPDSVQVVHRGAPLQSVIDTLQQGSVASAVTTTFVPTGTVGATNVQAAIQELDSEKQPVLVSGTNIKTVNGASLLGPGNITIAGSSSASAVAFSPGFSQIAATNVQDALTELDQEKQPLLVSGTHVKTVNGQSLVGPGNLVVGGATTASGVSVVPTGAISATTVQGALQELDAEKQPLLSSGVNIKTVNGQSLLGAGNLALAGGGTIDAAAIRTALTSTAATHNWIWNATVPGAVDAGPQQTIYLQRNAVYDNTVGLSGGVVSALYVETFTPTGTHNLFEWGITSALHSRSVSSIIPSGPLAGFASPQNVAVNGTVFRDAGNAPIWGGNFVAYHEFNEWNTTRGAMHGVEINVGGNGVDTGEQSIGVYVVPQLRSTAPGPGLFEGWTGVLVQGGGADTARWRNGITNRGGRVFGYLDQGTHQVAIDLSNSTNAESAIRIKANDWIALEATNAVKFKYNPSNGFIEFFSGNTRRGYINLLSGADVDLAGGGGGGSGVTLDTAQTITALKTFTGGIDANGIICRNGLSFDVSGTVQWSGNMTTLTAGSGFGALPANPAGFVKIFIDGQERKVPFYV